jgi:hypothetical protein
MESKYPQKFNHLALIYPTLSKIVYPHFSHVTGATGRFGGTKPSPPPPSSFSLST